MKNTIAILAICLVLLFGFGCTPTEPEGTEPETTVGDSGDDMTTDEPIDVDIDEDTVGDEPPGDTTDEVDLDVDEDTGDVDDGGEEPAADDAAAGEEGY